MRRKLLTSLAIAGLVAVGFGAAILPASADQRTLTVTLATGQTVNVTVDVPPCTPLDQIKLPDLPAPVIGVSGADANCPPPTTVPQLPVPGTGPSQPPPTPGQTTTPAPTEQPSTGDTQQTQPSKRHRRGKHGAMLEKGQALVEGQVESVTKSGKKPAVAATEFRAPDGVPTAANPTLSLALPGPAPIGVPNFFIDKFRIPPFLLPIYQAAGIQYGVRWEILAAINEIETDYGRNLNVSTAGAVGWMQFLPSTWKRWGVDANGDKRKDPYNPVDAIFAAARYLKAAGADKDLHRAIFAYNHADWYVDSVLLRAQLIGGLPADLVGSLTGLTQGHFPVHAKARYADDISEKKQRRVKKGNAAVVVRSNPTRRGINIYAKPGSPVVAVNDGVIKKIGYSARLGRFIILQDVYGNRYTYGQLKKVVRDYPVPKERTVSKAQIARELKLPKREAAPSQPATAGTQRQAARRTAAHAVSAPAPAVAVAAPAPATAVAKVTKQRLFANPARPAARKAGGAAQLNGRSLDSGSTFKSYFSRVFGLNRDDVVLKRLRPGARVIAGTILGRIGRTSADVAPHVLIEIRPAGRGAPRIDPKPILDGWKLLESTAIYRAAGKNPFFGPNAKNPSVGQILLMSKEALERRLLADPRVQVYSCGQRDIRAGNIDRRVLATLEFLAASGLKPTVSSLECGHGFFTASGNVSEHSSGNAVDIAAINGIPIVGHQGAGSITDITIRRLLTLQGAMKPHQIISLMTFEGADNTMALADHYNHIHVGFRPLYGANTQLGKQVNAILKPGQWIKLINRLNEIPNPEVPIEPSKYAIKVAPASTAHTGD